MPSDPSIGAGTLQTRASEFNAPGGNALQGVDLVDDFQIAEEKPGLVVERVIGKGRLGVIEIRRVLAAYGPKQFQINPS
jgi:hypothetical protein